MLMGEAPSHILSSRQPSEATLVYVVILDAAGARSLVSAYR
jgi:hypothetical protein